MEAQQSPKTKFLMKSWHGLTKYTSYSTFSQPLVSLPIYETGDKPNIQQDK
jgi:hypothetical protein